MELKDIKAIIDLMSKNDLSVFEMEKDGFRLKLQKGVGDQPAMAAPIVVSSMPALAGTFYRGASPEAPPFVDVGKTVTEDSVVCIIEAMKVMNEIKAETSGIIAEVVAENGKPVQFGQVLFRVR